VRVVRVSPELGGDGRGRGEVGELLADAGEEEPREAVAVDHRDAGGTDPPDEPEADHAQVPPQPVPGEPDDKQHESATISFHSREATSARQQRSSPLLLGDKAKPSQQELTSCR
jgi:hypothetical protein